MESKLTIDQDGPPNHLELSSEQSNGQLILKDNHVVSSLFSAIYAINQIQRESIDCLFKLNEEGRSLKAYNSSLDFHIRGIYSIELIHQSNYYSEHSHVIRQAFRKVVAPHIHPDDEPSFWNAPPNRMFTLVDEDTGEFICSHTTAELKNALIRESCILINEDAFKAAQSARSERAKNQYERSAKLVECLRAKFSKLLVLRIDLCWKAVIQDDSTVNEMKAFLSQLLKRFHHDPTLPNIVGYIWKLEFGQQKGYHYHCMFFMDGNKFQNDTHYAEVIGQRWAELTSNKGYYFNCHRDKIKYRNLAIGTAHHNDQTFYDNLDQVLVYICKQDQFLIDKRLLKPNLRVFGTSQLPSKASPVGRPRDFKNLPKPSTSLAVVVKKKQLRSTP